MLKLNRRLHVPEQRGDGSLVYKPNWGPIEWDPKKTAFIICDMWDQHWCQGAARRVVELAEPVNKFAHAARKRGVLVIHAPSTCVDFYKDTPERRRAQAATLAKPPVVLSQATRWGTRWCYPVEGREGELPIDDSDMGCDCATKCEIRTPWTRQIKLIDIEDGDAISDDGQEVYNLLAERGIDNVLIAGVHLNMCVLGRSFAIRQLVLAGKKVMLVRDLTDTMYNAKSRPFVDHFTGTDLVVEHVEKYWCPTITSVDLLGGQPFRFAEDKRR
ncbi:MAG: cysteine hydrolase family protein [Planctomycetia bacterium]|nr:cysteine hydrolase family protein [Planctomycetia bacterium]